MLGVAPTTWYVIVKAIPEHGERPPHSLLPRLSRVETSTTPGPLAVPTVHAPLTDKPLIQIIVDVGVVIRVPRAALVGFTKPASVAM